MSRELLRVIDANYNRAKEALRVTEDIARFYLADARLTSRYKRARHDLTRALLGFKMPYRRLVEARDSKEDVGRAGLIRDKKKLPVPVRNLPKLYPQPIKGTIGQSL